MSPDRDELIMRHFQQLMREDEDLAPIADQLVPMMTLLGPMFGLKQAPGELPANPIVNVLRKGAMAFFEAELRAAGATT